MVEKLSKVITLIAGMVFLENILQVNPVQAITFKKIADTSTQIPGNSQTFNYFTSPAISNNNVVFVGGTQFSEQQGIYADFGKGLQVIADRNTPVPGGEGNFDRFLTAGYNVSISDQNVLFTAREQYGNNQGQSTGVYVDFGSGLEVIADIRTPIPENSGNFNAFYLADISGTNVVFSAENKSFSGGIYKDIGQGLELVADDLNTTDPNTGSNFYLVAQPAISGNNVAFLGVLDSSFRTQGIYADLGSQLQVIIDTNTLIPETSTTFNSLSSPSISGTNIAFYGAGLGRTGIYANLNNELTRIADSSFLTPLGRLNQFSSPSIQGTNVAFLGGIEDIDGIYFTFNSPDLRQLITTGDVLDGKVVSRLGFDSGGKGFDGSAITFQVQFEDGSQGIFVAEDIEDAPVVPVKSIPEPLTFWGVGMTLGFGYFFKSKLSQKKQRLF